MSGVHSGYRFFTCLTLVGMTGIPLWGVSPPVVSEIPTTAIFSAGFGWKMDVKANQDSETVGAAF